MLPEEIFRHLYRIRRVEEEVARVYPTDKIQSPVHLSIGQEMASVAVCAASKAGDIVLGSYRSHALYMAAGGDLNAFVAELYGKAGGCAGGKGGSMHLSHLGPTTSGLRFVGTSAIVASLIPAAVGMAFAEKRKPSIPLMGPVSVVVVFFGDGATEQGVFYESMNFAALHRLPILFVCENNGLAIVSPIHDRQSSPIDLRAQAFGLRTRSTDDTTVLDRAAWMVEAIRNGEGPMLLEHHAVRLKEHVGPGDDIAAQPIYPDTLVAAGDGLISPAAIMAEVDAEIAAAFAFAEASPFPDASQLMADTYA